MRRLDAWRVLAGAIVVLALACAVLILSSPGPPRLVDSALPDVFIQDIRHAPTAQMLTDVSTLVPVQQQLEIDAGKLMDAGAVTAVNISRDGEQLVALAQSAPPGLRSIDLPMREFTQDGQYRIALSVAQPDDLAPLRWRSTVLRVLVVLLIVLAAGGLWISRRRHAEQERIGLIDPLTGVGNRRLLQRQANRVLRHTDSGRHHALLLIDIDHFKELNDTLGHAAGDSALKRLAEALQEAVRPGDHVIRLGGDEFAVLLEDVPAPPGDVALCGQVLQRMRGYLPDLGISGGSACWPADALDLAGLSHVADQAMYDDKRRRRSSDVRPPASVPGVTDRESSVTTDR